MDKQYEWVTMFEGVRRRIVADGKNVMQVKIELRKGTSVPRHRHEHEQISFIHSGRCRFDLDGTVIIAENPELADKAYDRAENPEAFAKALGEDLDLTPVEQWGRGH